MDNNLYFGKFFHSVRVAKGLPLMLFCRENNFNFLAVTNMERGSYIPTPDEVPMYAKALKIKAGTKAYKQFFEFYKKDVIHRKNGIIEYTH